MPIIGPGEGGVCTATVPRIGRGAIGDPPTTGTPGTGPTTTLLVVRVITFPGIGGVGSKAGATAGGGSFVRPPSHQRTLIGNWEPSNQSMNTLIGIAVVG